MTIEFDDLIPSNSKQNIGFDDLVPQGKRPSWMDDADQLMADTASGPADSVMAGYGVKPNPADFDLKKASAAKRRLEQDIANIQPSRRVQFASEAPPVDSGFIDGAARIGRNVVDAINQGVSGIVRTAGDITGLDAVSNFAKGSADASRRFAGKTVAPKTSIAGFAPGSIVQDLPRAAEGAAVSIGTQLPAIATGSLPTALALMFGQSYGQQYNEVRDRGLGVAPALANAGLTGTFEVVGERFGGLPGTMSALKGAIAGNAPAEVAAQMARAGLRDIPGELFTYAGQYGTDAAPVIGTNKTPSLDQFLEGATDTALQTVLQGGMMTGASAALAKARGQQPATEPTLADYRALVQKYFGGAAQQAAPQPEPVAQQPEQPPAQTTAPEPTLADYRALVQKYFGGAAQQAAPQPEPVAQQPEQPPAQTTAPDAINRILQAIEQTQNPQAAPQVEPAVVDSLTFDDLVPSAPVDLVVDAQQAIEQPAPADAVIQEPLRAVDQTAEIPPVEQIQQVADVPSAQTATAPAQAEASQYAQPTQTKPATQRGAPIMQRDDLVGAIMRVTGGTGIASNMAQTIVGDKANQATKVRGLFQNAGTMDLDDTADLLRTQEGFDVRDGNHLAELIREQAAGSPVYSMERTEREAAQNAEREYRNNINQQAEAMGLKKASGKRTLQMVEADIARAEAEMSAMEAAEERAAIQAESVFTEPQEMTEAEIMAWLSEDLAGTYTQEEIDYVKQESADRENARTEAATVAASDGEAPGRTGSRAQDGHAEEGAQQPDNLITSYTQQDLDQRIAKLEQAERERQQQNREAERRERADRERGDFALTGSDRTADANPNQGGIFSAQEEAPQYGGNAIEVDGVRRPRLNSNGKPIAQTDEALRNFWRWFGDSKAVDAEGRPLVVYHGTNAEFDTFDYGRIGQQGRAEGAGFYFTTNKDVASGYGNLMEVYLAIAKPMGYDQKGLSAPVLQKIVKRVAELESKAEGMEVGDGFLSNFGDVYSDGLNSVVKEAARLIAADETAIDQLSGIVGSGVNPEFVNAAVIEVTGYDGVVSDGFSNLGSDNENKIFVALTNTQIKSATGNRGTFDLADPSIVREESEEYNADAPRRKYTDDRQLQLFLDSEPDPSQTGPASDRARREAVAAVDDLRSTENVLGLALSRDYAARQRVSLVGQKVSSAEDLAILAQVYRDPRFETFRVIFTNDSGAVVSQVGLTSRLPASTVAIMGSDMDAYLRDLSATARNRGASQYYLLHNHPSGIANPSRADEVITQAFASRTFGTDLQFLGHVVIDTNEYSVINGKGESTLFKKDFGQPAPYRAEEWAGVKIGSPSDAMAMAKRLQVDDGAVTLIHTDSQYNVKAISTIPAGVFGNKQAVKKQVIKASLKTRGSQVFAVSRSIEALKVLGDSVVDAIHVQDEGRVQSLRQEGHVFGGQPFPKSRRPRVSPDTSPEFAYLRQKSQSALVQVAEDGPGYDPQPDIGRNRDALGRVKFRLGEVALHKLDAATRPLQERFGMRIASPELRKQLRQMKATIDEANRAVVNVATEMKAMTEADRAMVSGIVEKMIAPGVVPPEHAVKVADAITKTMDQQTNELVALGMLSKDSADRWRGRYLPRIYNRKTELADDPLIKRLFKTGSPTMQGIGGGSLKGRGLFQDVSVDAVDQWLAMGYEVRDPHWKMTQGKLELKDPNAPMAAREQVTVWRDWTPSERAQMGENRDALYRFAQGYTAMQRDIALGRLFDNIANNPDWVRRSAAEGWTKVPDTEIPDTGGVKRYGNLAGLYVTNDVMSHLTRFEEAANDSLQLYREALGIWKEGKALALDTKIPTPTGWKTMGDLQIGDTVFDERGEPCNVTYVTDTQLQRECYELEFSDGTKIVADAEHLWFTIYHGKGGVKNTLRIIETLKERTRGDNNHSIPVAGALQLPDADLPVPPYALGVWLGDGNTYGARITVGSSDANETLEFLRSCGIESNDGRKDQRGNVWSYGIRFADCGPRRCDGLQPTLRSIGVLGNKHIPDEYLRGSESQRRELLCGLMDTDGSVTTRGQCEFSTTSKALFDGMMELLRSLGYKPSFGEQIGRVNGKECSNVWRIKFQAFSDRPVFKLPRKVARLRERQESRPRSGTRQIVAVRPVDSVPVKCITVDSPNRLYLAGEGMVPTHNTALNPVAHFNNIMSNLSMAHFAGVSYWDGHKYVNAARDLVNDAPMVDESRKAGLFTGSYTKEELVNNMPPELQKLMQQDEGKTRKMGRQVMNAMTFWLRQPLRNAYEFEDTYFKYLIYRDARKNGMTPEEATDYALRYIFTYDDLPSGARKVRDYAIPFFSWTYKAVPALLHTAMVYPWRFLAPAAALHGINLVAYALAAGDEDDNWLEKIAKGREQEKEEREALPEFREGMGMLGNPKMIRLGSDSLTGNPVFLDASRVVPGGDMFDMVNQTGGMPLPAPLMPNHPVLSAFSAMIANREMFMGRDVVDKNDTGIEAAEKRAKWMAGMMLPAVAPGGYHSQRIADAAAYAMDTTITVPGFGEFTGIDRSGQPVQPKYAAMQTVGIKARPVDLDLEMQRKKAKESALVNSIAAEVRSLARLHQRGAVSDEKMQREREKAREKIERMREEY